MVLSWTTKEQELDAQTLSVVEQQQGAFDRHFAETFLLVAAEEEHRPRYYAVLLVSGALCLANTTHLSCNKREREVWGGG